MSSSSIFTEATIRGVLTAFLNAALIFLSSLQMNVDMRVALIISGQVFIAQTLLRVFGEGAYDSRRNAVGDVHRSDVGSNEVVTRVSVPTNPPEPSTTTTTTVTTNPDDSPGT